MANVPFSTSVFGKALRGSIGARRPTIGILGDSYGGYLGAAVQYACMKFYPADITYDARTIATGGRLFAVGGTTSATMLATQLPQFQATPTDIAFIWTGYNSTPNSLATAITEAANITNTAAGCLATGACSLVVIMGQSWRVSGNPQWIETVNSITRNFANNTPGVAFCDVSGLIMDPTSTSTTAIAPRAGYSADGVHPSGHCIRVAIAPLLAPILEAIARRRLPRASTYGAAFSPTTSPDVDVMGGAGLMLGTSGQLNSVNNAGVAGLSSTYRWNIIPSNAEVVVTPTIVTGADGFLRQRMTLSGTTTAVRNIIFQCQPTTAAPDNGNTANLYDLEMMADLTGVTGLMDMVITGPTNYLFPPFSGGVSNAANLYPDGTNENGLFMYGLSGGNLSGSNPSLRIIAYLASGKTLAGTIDFYRGSTKRIAP